MMCLEGTFLHDVQENTFPETHHEKKSVLSFAYLIVFYTNIMLCTLLNFAFNVCNKSV